MIDLAIIKIQKLVKDGSEVVLAINEVSIEFGFYVDEVQFLGDYFKIPHEN